MDKQSVWAGDFSNYKSVEKLALALTFEFPEIVEEFAEYILIEVGRDIMRKTGMNTIEREFTIYCGVTDYTIPLPECVELVRIEGIWDGDSPMRFLVDREINQVRFPAVSSTRKVFVRMSVAVKPESCELPEMIVDTYRDALLHGARARVHSTASSPYYNPDLIKINNQSYERAVREILIDGFYGSKSGFVEADFGRFV